MAKDKQPLTSPLLDFMAAQVTEHSQAFKEEGCPKVTDVSRAVSAFEISGLD
jgi:hypothetical protein